MLLISLLINYEKEILNSIERMKSYHNIVLRSEWEKSMQWFHDDVVIMERQRNFMIGICWMYSYASLYTCYNMEKKK